MKRLAKKIKTNKRQRYRVSFVDRAMDEVKETGELPNFIPDHAPKNLRKFHEETKKSLQQLDTDYQTKLKAHLDSYTQGLLKKTTELEPRGFHLAVRAIKKFLEDIGEDPSKFLATLGLNE